MMNSVILSGALSSCNSGKRHLCIDLLRDKNRRPRDPHIRPGSRRETPVVDFPDLCRPRDALVCLPASQDVTAKTLNGINVVITAVHKEAHFLPFYEIYHAHAFVGLRVRAHVEAF